MMRTGLAAIVTLIGLSPIQSANGYLPVFGGANAHPTNGSAYYSMQNLLSFAGTPQVGNGIAIHNAYLGSNSFESQRAIWFDSSGAPARELPSLGGYPSGSMTMTAAAFHETGGIAGMCESRQNGVFVGYRAVRWDPQGGSITMLGRLGDYLGGIDLASAINASGMVAGVADKVESGVFKGLAPTRWDEAGNPTELGSLTSEGWYYPYPTLTAINSAGDIVGVGNPTLGGKNQGMRAVRWNVADNQAVELAGLNTGVIAIAGDLNDAGVAVGTSAKLVNGANVGYRATRWSDLGQVTELGNLGVSALGRTDSESLEINEAGVAIGYADKYENGVPKGRRAVRWAPVGIAAEELAVLSTDNAGVSFSFAYAINAANIGAGYARSYDTSGNNLGNHAVVWDALGRITDLNSLIDPLGGWTLQEAYDLSDSNWIIGAGLYDSDGTGPLTARTRAFMMQIPEPHNALLLVISGTFGVMIRPVRFGLFRSP